MSKVGEPGPPDLRAGCAYGYLVGQWTSSGNSAAECLYAVQNLNVDSDGRTPSIWHTSARSTTAWILSPNVKNSAHVNEYDDSHRYIRLYSRNDAVMMLLFVLFCVVTCLVDHELLVDGTQFLLIFNVYSCVYYFCHWPRANWYDLIHVQLQFQEISTSVAFLHKI